MTNKVLAVNPTDTLVFNTGYTPDVPQFGGEYCIDNSRPYVVDLDDPFIKRVIAQGRIQILPGPKLPDEIGDKDFVEYFEDKPETAVEDFYLLGEAKPLPVPALPKKKS